MVGATNDGEIKAPILVDSSLPSIIGFVILLGAERGMMQILLQEFGLYAFCIAAGAFSRVL